MKKCYWAHLVMTQPKFVARILQHRWILNILISRSLVFCSFGKTFCLQRLRLKVKQSTCNLWMKQRSMLRCLVPTARVPYLPLPCTDTGRSHSTLGTWSFPSMWTWEIGIQSSGPLQMQKSFQLTTDIPHLKKNNQPINQKQMKKTHQGIRKHPVDQCEAMSCQTDPYWLCHTPQDATQTLSKCISCSFQLGLGEIASWEGKINQ